MTAALLLVSVPFLTALALAALRSEALAERIDRWVVTLALPAAIGLTAWSGGLDRLGLLSAGLVWVTAALARWGGAVAEGGAGFAARALDQVVLGGLLLVCMVAGGTHGVAVWAAVVVVVGASVLRGGDKVANPTLPLPLREGAGGRGIAARTGGGSPLPPTPSLKGRGGVGATTPAPIHQVAGPNAATPTP